MKKRFNTQIFRSVRALVLNAVIAIGPLLSASPAHPDSVVQSASATPRKEPPTAPAESDGAGIVVRLEMPWKVLLWGEIPSYNYVLENHSQAPIPVAIPYRQYGIGAPNGGQLFLEGHYDPVPQAVVSPYHSDIRLLRVEEADWPPLTVENQPVDLWTELPPGQRILWNHARACSAFYPISVDENLRSLQAHWLVGKGRWVSSPRVDVKVEKVDRKLWQQVFLQKYNDFGNVRAPIKMEVNKIPIDGKLFLFTKVLSRICEVGADDKLSFKIDAENDQMEVTIRAAAGVKTHYYAMGQGLVRDTPWKAQGYAALMPEIEPITKSDLVLPPKGAIHGSQQMPTKSSVHAIPKAESRWPWRVVGATVLLFLATAIVRLRRKQKLDAKP